MSLTIRYYSDLHVLDQSSYGFADQISNSLVSAVSDSLITLQNYSSSTIYVADTAGLTNNLTATLPDETLSTSSFDPSEGIPSATSVSASTTVTPSVAAGSFDSPAVNGATVVAHSGLSRKIFFALAISSLVGFVSV